MFTNFFGRVKNPCDDCVNGECTMNCSGREPAEPSGDKGTLIITYEKDNTVTVRARAPDEYAESKVNLPIHIWRAMVTIKSGGNKGGPTESNPDRPYCKPDQSCCDFVCGN